MSDALILEFPGGTAEQYKAVSAAIGFDPVSGHGRPAGMLSHTGTTTAGGDVLVFEVWESQAAQAAFMESVLGPALGEAGVPKPTRVEWLTVLGHDSV
jgi:hypothetical protein